MTRFIDENKSEFGVEPICEQLKIAPSTYYARTKRTPSARAVRDEGLKTEIARGVRLCPRKWCTREHDDVKGTDLLEFRCPDTHDVGSEP